ncbi:hypothetical protein 65p421 [Aeromonas phage 65]|uniref:Uncharacterized protein n=2 Tax=Ishigurovirus osborne TaxID=260149 RepID=A0A219YCP2_9CAUD|nr:hypothetical protein ST65p421 [Aeromonas phage 65]ADQ53427.1 hypothetical protein 65p421 [Aeromonas phage 65]APU01784.1 hypothetical protein [Aeromonas phage 65.2]
MLIDQFGESMMYLVGSNDFFINPYNATVVSGDKSGPSVKMSCEEYRFLLSDDEIELVKESIIGTFSIVQSLIDENATDIYIKGYHLDGSTLTVHMTYLDSFVTIL